MDLVQFLLTWNHGVDQKKARHSWVTYRKVNSVFRRLYNTCGGIQDLPSRPNNEEGYRMTSYDFYWEDQQGNSHFFGTLPERRRNPERITHESVMNWGRMVMGDREGIKKIYFVKVDE